MQPQQRRAVARLAMQPERSLGRYPTLSGKWNCVEGGAGLDAPCAQQDAIPALFLFNLTADP